ncbi:hypothetical protein BU25DRAFT_485283 [Macroventuria anomochaeta]|uniref:Uncharacterized protein n=1 Tax=Macroventuria anomochaeta TaxID=301207 RepID=A0ACB6S7V4_9PLEO|nr:uncharacterized protein BU25DRAFT_485283 [Macroventuria anomochaeta]KAF2630077.1 hypothetical protein BU25DRAFT_485283 [Macroventuria anomochaeta]
MVKPLEHVCLIHIKDKELVGPYATLSHRWGKANFIQLTLYNLDDLCNRIAITNIPRTFREAAVVSKALQIRYLWIDSVCFKQDRDDFADWSHKASQIHKVYSHSHVNIAASDAEDSSKGLFRVRNPHMLHPANVDFSLRIYLEGDSDQQPYILSSYELFRQSLAESTLNNRG